MIGAQRMLLRVQRRLSDLEKEVERLRQERKRPQLGPVTGEGDMGDGRSVRLSVTYDPLGRLFVVRRYRSRKMWTVPREDGIGVLVRRAQVLESMRRMGR